MVKVRDELPKAIDGSIDIEAWVERLSEGKPEQEKNLISQAAYINLESGGHQLTPVRETCLKQGLVTAEILNTLNPDTPTLLAGILYYVVDFGELSLKSVTETFGKEVSALIDGVSKLAQHSEKAKQNQTHAQRDNLRRMLLAVVEDVRVVLVKLAEKISALRAATQLDNQVKVDLALETRDIYAPLANRLGIGQIKWELEDFAFRYLEPVAYKNIAKLLAEKRLDRETYIENVLAEINKAVLAEDIKCEISGRVKHIYSIWRKMIRKNLDFQEIYDVRAVRILVPNIHDCYAVLGIIHSLWQYIPQEFDDYIASPKENGYRSLHTAVVGPEGKTLEIQIRSFKMHDEAELGVAAHWLYKEDRKHDPSYHSQINALRKSLEWRENQEFESDEAIKQELSEDRVFVFTPQGESIDLPAVATPLDCAYHVHTELGHRCRGAKINGKIKTLTYTLNSGEQVDIITTKIGAPSRDWMNAQLGYLVSARARSKVRSWFKRQDRNANITEGKELLDRELKRLDLGTSTLKPIIERFNVKSLDDLYAGVGGGDIRIGQIVNSLQKITFQESQENLIPTKQRSIHNSSSGDEITIHGVGNLMCHFAGCCNPVPGDPIIGYITIGRGVTIHKQDCINVLEKDDEVKRLIQVDWGDNTTKYYSVDLSILAYDRQNLLRDITNVLSNDKINVRTVNTQTSKDTNIANLILSVEIPDLDTLMNVLNKIMQLPNVLEASRVGMGKKDS